MRTVVHKEYLEHNPHFAPLVLKHCLCNAIVPSKIDMNTTTDDNSKVTCKRCLKILEKQPPYDPNISFLPERYITISDFFKQYIMSQGYGKVIAIVPMYQTKDDMMKVWKEPMRYVMVNTTDKIAERKTKEETQ